MLCLTLAGLFHSLMLMMWDIVSLLKRLHTSATNCYAIPPKSKFVPSIVYLAGCADMIVIYCSTFGLRFFLLGIGSTASPFESLKQNNKGYQYWVPLIW